jgi:hypothetical protein
MGEVIVRSNIMLLLIISYGQHKQHPEQLKEDLHSLYPPQRPTLHGLDVLSKSTLEDDVLKVSKSIPPATLYHLCHDHNIYRGGTTNMMVIGLLQWVSSLFLDLIGL